MRTRKSFYNILATFGASISALIFNFLTQKVLISVLGIEYSGANGLFTNILNMLSIAELGIGSAIVFKLYKPIADNDIEAIKSWTKFYKICYRYIVLIISIIGIILAPFIPKIIGKSSINENLIILYILSLLDIIFSYIMTYKRSLLYANQKNYIVNIIHMIYLMLVNITQIAFLYITKNYLVFIVVKIIFRLLENLVINFYVNKKYPFINEPAKEISKEEKSDVFQRIKAIFVQKVSYQINKGIDSVIITFMFGVAIAGYYTNYHLIVVAILRIIYWIITSMTASVGNLLTENNINKNYEIYKKMNLLNSFLACVSVAGFMCCANSFIGLWVGSKYILSIGIVLSFAIYIFSDCIRNVNRLFKDAAGICVEDRRTYIIAIFLNILLSIILCKFIGVSGVIIGTAISYFYLIVYSYPKYVFLPLTNKNYSEYFKEFIKYFIATLIATIFSFGISSIICFNSYFIQFLFNATISILNSIIIFFIFFSKTNEFDYYLKMIKKRYKKILKS